MSSNEQKEVLKKIQIQFKCFIYIISFLCYYVFKTYVTQYYAFKNNFLLIIISNGTLGCKKMEYKTFYIVFFSTMRLNWIWKLNKCCISFGVLFFYAEKASAHTYTIYIKKTMYLLFFLSRFNFSTNNIQIIIIIIIIIIIA